MLFAAALLPGEVFEVVLFAIALFVAVLFVAALFSAVLFAAPFGVALSPTLEFDAAFCVLFCSLFSNVSVRSKLSGLWHAPEEVQTRPSRQSASDTHPTSLNEQPVANNANDAFATRAPSANFDPRLYRAMRPPTEERRERNEPSG